MIILYGIAYGVYDATRIFMTRQAQTHTHTLAQKHHCEFLLWSASLVHRQSLQADMKD